MIGMKPFRSALVASWAILTRASLVTLAEWPKFWAIMIENVDRKLITLRCVPWDNHWKTPAFAYALRQASLNQVLPKHAAQVGEAGLKIARKSLASGDQKIQTALYNKFLSGVKGENVLQLIQRRISEHLGITVCLDAWVELMKAAPPHIQWCSLKTWLGAWTTTHRLLPDKGVKQCLCGCEAAKDSWLHYSRCADIWTIAFTTAGLPPIGELSERLHYLLCTTIGLKITALAFMLYHRSKDCQYPRTFDELEHSAIIAWRYLSA